MSSKFKVVNHFAILASFFFFVSLAFINLNKIIYDFKVVNNL